MNEWMKGENSRLLVLQCEVSRNHDRSAPMFKLAVGIIVIYGQI